jgi:nucleoside-diphosphate-sugar epimerase
MKINSRVVIVSGSSFIGRDTIKKLKNIKNLNIISRKRLKYPICSNSQHKFFNDNLLAKKNISKYLAGAEFLINFAYIKRNKTDNLRLIRNLIYSVNQSNIKRFIHISTAVVSGFRQNGLLNEKSVNSPASDYQITKLRIENELKKNLSKKINLIIIRPTEVVSVKNKTIIDKIITRSKSFYLLNYFINFFLKNRKINLVCLPNLIEAIVFFCSKEKFFLSRTYIVSDSNINCNYGFFFNFINTFIGKKNYNFLFSINLKLLILIYRIFLPTHSNPGAYYTSNKIQLLGYKRKITLIEYLIKIIKFKNV